MKIKKISFVLGTRPQIIKSQPLIKHLKKDGFSVEIINTGQHYDYDLSQKFFSDLKIVKPSINLEVGSGTPLEQISKIIIKLERYFKKKKPDLVFVPGDTTSALAGALAASKLHLKLAHLESGARSNQLYMQEEINRRLIDHCSDYLFAPTKNCLQNLKKESVSGKSFFLGDTMYDLFQLAKKKYKLNKSNLGQKQILVTIHRTESIENKSNLAKICSILNELHKKGFTVLFPLHPHTKKMLKKFGLNLKMKTEKPFGYIELLQNLSNSKLVITDSGGLQKEAYWMGIPCIVLRENTEWTETIHEGGNQICPLSKPVKIQNIIRKSNQKFVPKKNMFGDGNASGKIAKIIKSL